MIRIGSKENIVFVPNLLTTDECVSITNYCESVKLWHSNSYDGSNDKVHSIASFSDSSLSALKVAVNSLHEKIENRFGRELGPQFPGIRKWEVGDYQPLHADGEDTDGNPNEAYAVDYASVIYINDNYSGGEIEFPLQEIIWKPVSGTAVFFPANKWFAHKVHEVTCGTRYTSAQFWVPTKHLKLQDFYATKR